MALPLAITVVCACLQVALTMWAIFAMGRARIVAIRKYKLSKSEIAVSTDVYPVEAKILAANAHNQFETPTLFFGGIALAAALDAVNWGVALSAVAFVATRLAHRAIHVGQNDVTMRFYVFCVGLLALISLWAALGVALVL